MLQECMLEAGVTRVGLLQLVPAEEGSFLLLTEVRSLLQEPVGDPTLADSFTIREPGHQEEPTLDYKHWFNCWWVDAYPLPERPLPGRCVC